MATGFSQTDDFKPYSSFGIKQGVNYSSVLFVPSVKQGIPIGYWGGLTYKYQNERLFGLQVELNFIQKGWEEEFENTENTYQRTLNYIELPFITHIVMGKRKLKYYVNLGTSFGYLLSENENKKLSEEITEKEYYGKKAEKKVEYSGFGDVGIVYDSNIGEFQAGFRYIFSFTDIFNVTDDTYYYQSQNSTLAFSITYFLFSNK
jgi:hypothetical protein